MPTFRRVETVDARQFTGGIQNGTDLVFWINSNYGNAFWYEGSTKPERIKLTTDTFSGVIYVGDWVILRQDGSIDYARPQNFEAMYNQV